MKTILVILLLLCFVATSQVNVNVYGAVGDGVNDDTQAIQNALNASVFFISGNVYRVSGQITITKSGNQSILGNGATIIATAYLLNVFYLDKATGVLTLDGLNKDGQSNIVRSYNISNITKKIIKS